MRVLCPVLCHNGDERGVEDARNHTNEHTKQQPGKHASTDWDAALDSEGEEEEEEIDEDFDLDEPVDEAPIDDADKNLPLHVCKLYGGAVAGVWQGLMQKKITLWLGC